MRKQSEKFQNKKYMMHKYWGKKPGKELREIVLKYSNEQDLLLDPFAGYGGFSSEAVLANRNIISNDLNPMSNFINARLLSTDVDFDIIDSFMHTIKAETQTIRDYWYSFDKDGTQYEILTTLRRKNGEVVKHKILGEEKRKSKEIVLSPTEVSEFREKENDFVIKDWFPMNELIPNSRISAKKNMTVSDLFDTRSLSSHARLFKVINSFPDCEEKNLLLFAFTSNLANASRLVPPIKSRGDMAQGAWMTGFYIGETYLENNVFHYFENRVAKIVAGKKEYLNQYYDLFQKGNYIISNQDAKNLSIADKHVDLVFTDFPYGDAVPYFEQSIIWNSWLKFNVDYENEIVISDSKIRNKGSIDFNNGISKSISEIHRVLKDDGFFIFTYHSLSGFEWASITNALLQTGFEIIDCKLLEQKTFTPRQLNRKKTIKGDLLIVSKKNTAYKQVREFPDTISEEEFVKKLFVETINNGFYETNEIIVEFLKRFFKERVVIRNLNIISLLQDIAIFDGKGWIIKNENI